MGLCPGSGSLKVSWGYASELWPEAHGYYDMPEWVWRGSDVHASDYGFREAESFNVRWRVRGSSDAWSSAGVKRSVGVLDLNRDGKPAEMWEYEIGGLVNGTVYEVGVAAVNAAGTGVHASVSGAACPAGQGLFRC